MAYRRNILGYLWFILVKPTFYTSQFVNCSSFQQTLLTPGSTASLIWLSDSTKRKAVIVLVFNAYSRSFLPLYYGMHENNAKALSVVLVSSVYSPGRAPAGGSGKAVVLAPAVPVARTSNMQQGDGAATMTGWLLNRDTTIYVTASKQRFPGAGC